MFPLSAHPDDLFTAVKPFYHTLRLLGMAPVTCILIPAAGNQPRRQFYALTTASVAYSIFVCFVIVALFVTSLHLRIKAHFKVTLLPIREDIAILATEAVNTLVLYFACLSFVIFLLINRRRVVDYYEAIGEIDANLLRHPKKLYRKTQTLIIKQFITVFSNLLVTFVIDYTIKYNALGIIAANSLCITYIIYLFMYFANLQFMDMILLIRQRFKIVNLEIVEIANELALKTRADATRNGGPVTLNGETKIAMDTESIPKRIKTLRDIQFKLFKLSNEVNHINGLPILLSLTSIFINIISNMYVTLAYIMTRSLHLNKSAFYYVAFVKFFWALQYWLIAVKLTIVCTTTHHEYSRAGVLIQEVLLDDRQDGEVVREFERFLKQVMNMRMKFTAFGFFDINYGLLCALAGAVTTYLVVLLQFQDGKGVVGEFWEKLDNVTGGG